MKIGNIISIDYSQIRVKILSEISGGSINVRGNIYYFGNIGSYLKTSNALGETIICEVISIFDVDAKKEDGSFNIESNRQLVLKPLGTITQDGEFALGVGIFPTIYSSVEIVAFEDMELILRTKESNEFENDKPKSGEGVNTVHNSFGIGISKNLINYSIKIKIDDFFNIHSAVLGNSGSGKSNTIAHIIQQIHKEKNYSARGSKIIIFDVNGEYKQAFKKDRNLKLAIKYYKPNHKEESDNSVESFFMPHFLFTLDEWSDFLIASDATQKPFWAEVLKESSRIYEIYSSELAEGIAESEKRKDLAIYLLNRLFEMINNVLTQGKNDASACGSAKSILNRIKNLIAQDPFPQGIREKDLFGTITIKVLDKRQGHAKGDTIPEIIQESNLDAILEGLLEATYFDYGNNYNVLYNAIDEIKEHIALEETVEISDNGKCFNHKFLKFAAEILLLEEDSRGNTQIRNWISTMLTRLKYFLENDDCSFMRGSEDDEGYKDDEGYLKKFFDITNSQNQNASQLIIIDTSELSPDILETLTSVVSRLIFDYRKKLKNNGRVKKPIHLILDEAHRYIKKDQKHLLKENIFEKIAREGRKYSFYLMISSQRPSEMSETVLSQCANFIVHQIRNETDMRYIRAILPYFSDDFTHKIKQSVPGEALIFGKCVPMPLHVKVELANPKPDSENCEIAKEWFRD